MKKNLSFLLTLACVMWVLSACEKKVSVSEEELIGRWEAPSQFGGNGNAKFVLVFQSDECVIGSQSYGSWGYQFDEGDDQYESDLTYHGSGWFGWRISDGNRILLVSASDMSVDGNAQSYAGAQISIKSFSSSSMTIEDAGLTYNMIKVQ